MRAVNVDAAGKPTLILLLYHGIGHFNACFRVAKILQEEYNVTFAGWGLFRQHVERQGFTYYSLRTVPFGFGFEPWHTTIEKKTPVYLHALKDRWTNRLFRLREAELRSLLENLRPDCLLIDSLQSTDLIVVYPYAKKSGIRVGFIQTMLPQSLRKDCPPINSLVFPDDRHGIQTVMRWFYLVHFIKRMVDNVKFLGRSNASIIRGRMRRNQMNRHYSSSEVTPRGIPFRGIEEFILAPQEFDFQQNVPMKTGHYVGFMPDMERNETADATVEELRDRIKNNNHPVIYCSFGTVKWENRNVASFIKKLIQIARRKPSLLIISMGAAQLSYTGPSLPHNVLLLASAPQLEILARADLFITHGGLNSIKEAVYTGVPMLVYPLNPKLDQRGNSTRVVFHQLGLRGSLRSDSENEIEEKMEELLGNPKYKQRLRELKLADAHYTAENLRELIRGIQALV